MVLEQALGKIGLKPAFSTKFKEAVPKTEVLEQPQLLIVNCSFFPFTFYFLSDAARLFLHAKIYKL
jgi:hypothetical protein